MKDHAKNLEDGLPVEYYSDLDKHLKNRRLPMDLDEFMDLEFRYFLSWHRNQTPMGSHTCRENQSIGNP